MSQRHPRRTLDALDFLNHDHDVLCALFKAYARRGRGRGERERRRDLAAHIGYELSLHAQTEAQVFYPAVRGALPRNAPLDQVLQDHAEGARLLAELDELEPGDEGYEASVAALEACVMRHIAMEQAQVFPLVRVAEVDTAALGWEMDTHRQRLQDDITCIGLPVGRAGSPAWPVSSRLMRA